MTAVRMPRGKSMTEMLRLTQSTATRKTPPREAAAGRSRRLSLPVSIRPTWGMMSPIQPTVPEEAPPMMDDPLELMM